MFRVFVTAPLIGTGTSEETVPADYSIEELEKLGWTIQAIREERDVDGELITLTWCQIIDPKWNTIVEYGSNLGEKEELSHMAKKVNGMLATTTGTDDPVRPDLPDGYAWGNDTNLPEGVVPPVDPGVAFANVLCEDQAAIDALEATGVEVWYVEDLDEEENNAKD